MNKTAIKVIKRKDAEAAANIEARDLSGQTLAAALSEEKTERCLRRKTADTISNWIAERRKNNRAEEVLAFRQLFGDEFLSGRMA